MIGASAVGLAALLVTMAYSLHRGLDGGAFRPWPGQPITRDGHPRLYRLLTVVHAGSLGALATLLGRSLA
jgi:hypothetical protein